MANNYSGGNTLIKSYGLYWKSDFVFWGERGKLGRLLGRKINAVTTGEFDFREQVGFYALYDEHFQLVYFGQVGSKKQALFERLKQHRKGHLAGRWSRFSWFGTRFVTRDGTLSAKAATVGAPHNTFLNQVEAVVIAVSEPPNNLQGGRFGGKAIQYVQHRDNEMLGPSQEEMLWQVYSQL